ncbi:hypothetical protein F2Q69_00012830 [Brassica cretica]|uniref:Uncharacterized protein n=1 Tax=Brassica cretica TaxID=69181 RepID=A0A8S9QZJ4_BRACR|nr:hypothetical protein F2Q69_00012830 [Brassica cretica]
MLTRDNSPHHAVSVRSTSSRDHAKSRCLHNITLSPRHHTASTTSHCLYVIRATTFTRSDDIMLSPRESFYHILNLTQASRMPALAMNHATSHGRHMIQSRNDATSGMYILPP